jgi:putative redox protein
MAEQLTATVKLKNQKIQFSGKVGSNPEITIDYVPPLGDGAGYLPLELLLISLASCSGSTVATFLRRLKKTVSGMTVSALGERRDEHPTSFKKIVLEFVVTSPDAGEEDMKKAIQLSADSFCPVWAMLKNSVEIIPEFKITGSKGD